MPDPIHTVTKMTVNVHLRYVTPLKLSDDTAREQAKFTRAEFIQRVEELAVDMGLVPNILVDHFKFEWRDA